MIVQQWTGKYYEHHEHHVVSRADDQRNKREKAEKKKEIELGIIDQERGKFVELSISNTMVSLTTGLVHWIHLGKSLGGPYSSI